METLFTIASFELFVGGGGRLTPIGPFSLRMIFFGLCILSWGFVSVLRRQPQDGQKLALVLVAAYFLAHFPAMLIGMAKGFEFASILTEAQQSLYWLTAPFFAMVLNKPDMTYKAAKLIQLAGVTLSLAYIAVISGLFLNILSFENIYFSFSESNEFFFRGTSFFFYKGFLYLGIALVFFLSLQEKYWKAKMLLVCSALILTLTRGFVLSASVAIIFLLLAQRRWRPLLVTLIGVVIAFFLVWNYLPGMDELTSGRNDRSTSQRDEDLNYILENISPTTILFGEGFGSLINDRSSIENTFLWALWKLGLGGFLFWLTPLAICFYFYSKVQRNGEHWRLACGYFFGVCLVYVQTATNPYLNNPIGLSFVIIAIFSLRTLSISNEKILTYNNIIS